MASIAAGASAQDKIVIVLSQLHFDAERGERVPGAFTREALATATGLSLAELREPLANLMTLGQVITRTPRSGELLFKLKDAQHSAWRAQQSRV
jgi:hypothetical protein